MVEIICTCIYYVGFGEHYSRIYNLFSAREYQIYKLLVDKVYTFVRRLQLIIRPSLLYFSIPQLRQPLSNDLVENVGIFEMNPMGPSHGLKSTTSMINFAQEN